MVKHSFIDPEISEIFSVISKISEKQGSQKEVCSLKEAMGFQEKKKKHWGREQKQNKP